MNSVIETRNTTPNYDLLDLELFIGAVENTLTETRYDEIIRLLAEANLPNEIFAQSIFQGQRAWQEKHWQQYGFFKAPGGGQAVSGVDIKPRFNNAEQPNLESSVVQSSIFETPFVSATSEPRFPKTPKESMPAAKTRVHH